MHENESTAHKVGTSLNTHQGAAASRGLPNKVRRKTTLKRPRPTGAAETAEAENRICEMQVRICKALANTTRLRMLDLLGKTAYTVSGLQAELGIHLTNVSVQLATLRSACVLVTE